MSVTDEELMALADGELDPARAAELEALVQADATLADRLARQRGLAERVRGAYAGALDEPLPERLTALASGQVVALPERRRPAAAWWGGAAIAASLAAGVLIGRTDLWAPAPALVAQNGRVTADGELARALSDRLAADPQTGAVRLGVSFKRRDGGLCRTFAIEGEAVLAGLACREGDDWRVRVAETADAAPSTPYRTAASLPAGVLAAIDASIEGEPLDAAGEAAARARGWRP